MRKISSLISEAHGDGMYYVGCFIIAGFMMLGFAVAVIPSLLVGMASMMLESLKKKVPDHPRP